MVLDLGTNVDEWCALGASRRHLVELPGMGLVQAEAGAALRRLQRRAKKHGITLEIASGYRDYNRQLALFNGKARGARPVTNDCGVVLDRADFGDREWLGAILRYSALPGTSRHHWGTDFDIWDPTKVPTGYALGLELAEYRGDGPFAEMSAWLDALIVADDAEGFFRPYTEDTGGVAPEPWHISFRPGAEVVAQLLIPDRLQSLWSCRCNAAPTQPDEPLAMLETVVAERDSLLARYVVT